MPDLTKICVIYNPTSGRGRAIRGIERMRQHSRFRFELLPTSKPGDAESLAERAVRDGYGKIVAAGGDGTVHEVANGLLRADCPEVVLAVWPFGSANDYAYTLGVTENPTQSVAVRNVDVGEIKAPGGKRRFFINGMGIGFNGNVTVEARKIRWLRGVPLYSLAVFKAMVRHFDKPKTFVRSNGESREVPTLALTVNIGKREGGFPLTPQADLSDGLFDYLHAGPVSRRDLLRHFPNMIRGTMPTDHPRMWIGRCRQMDVTCETPMRIHLDGEFFCHPEDGIDQVSIRMLPGRLRVECSSRE